MGKYRGTSSTAQEVDVNPLYERHARAPYDPLYSAEAGGRATGDVLCDPRFPRWVRIIGYIAGAAFLGALVIAFMELVRFTS
jgi:hypothetical protein